MNISAKFHECFHHIVYDSVEKKKKKKKKKNVFSPPSRIPNNSDELLYFVVLCSQMCLCMNFTDTLQVSKKMTQIMNLLNLYLG